MRKRRTEVSEREKEAKRKARREQIRDGLIEAGVELGFMLVCLLIGFGFFALVGAKAPEDPEIVMLLGMVLMMAIGLLAACVVLVVKGLRDEKKSKQKKESDSEKKEGCSEESKDSDTEGE